MDVCIVEISFERVARAGCRDITGCWVGITFVVAGVHFDLLAGLSVGNVDSPCWVDLPLNLVVDLFRGFDGGEGYYGY